MQTKLKLLSTLDDNLFFNNNKGKTMKKLLFLILTLTAFAAHSAADLSNNLIANGNMETEYNCMAPPALPKTCTDIPGWKLLKSPGANAGVLFQPNVNANRLYLSVSGLPPYNYAQAAQDASFPVTAGLYRYWFTSYVAFKHSYARIVIYNSAKQVIKYIDILLPKDDKYTKHTDLFAVPVGAAFAEMRFGMTAPGWLLVDNVIVNRRPYVVQE